MNKISGKISRKIASLQENILNLNISKLIAFNNVKIKKLNNNEFEDPKKPVNGIIREENTDAEKNPNM